MASNKVKQFVFVDQSVKPGEDTHAVLQRSRKQIRRQVREHTVSRWKQARLQSFEVRSLRTPETGVGPSKRKEGRKSDLRSDEIHDDVSLSADLLTSVQIDRAVCIAQQVPPNMKLTGYERARATHGYDVAWLSSMTVNHAGRVPTDCNNNSAIPSIHKSSVQDWLRLRETSYLDLVPSVYESSLLVRNLVDAVLIKLEDVITPSSVPKTKVLGVYGEALKSVQKALQDEKALEGSETLCATQIIQLYELLDTGAPAIWIAHTQGMHNLIRLKGPARFRTKLDKAILAAQFPHIFNQAGMRNADCFLEEPEWQELLKNMASEDEPSYYPLLVDFWRIVSFQPRLMRQTADFVYHEHSPLDKALLLSQLRALKSNVGIWRERYLRSSARQDLGPVLWKNLFSVSLGTESIANRLIIALEPGADDAERLENEIQGFAHQAMGVKTENIVTQGYYIGMISIVTKDEWMGALEGKSGLRQESRNVISADILKRWNGMLGRSGKYGSYWPDVKPASRSGGDRALEMR